MVTTVRGLPGAYERDPDVNDDFAMARRYNYNSERFSSPDSVMGDPSDPQSWNRYTYVQSDSVNYVDPNGTNQAMPCEGGSGSIASHRYLRSIAVEPAR